MTGESQIGERPLLINVDLLRNNIMPGASNISKARERPLLATGRHLRLLGQHEATLLVLVQRVLLQLLELAQVLSLLARLRPEPLVVVNTGG